MSDKLNISLETRGIVFINDTQKSSFLKCANLYECFVCGCKLRSEKNAVTHAKNQHHSQEMIRFNKYFTIVPSNTLGKVTLSCKFCDSKPTWEESKNHIEKHNVVSWLKPDDMSRTFFRFFISQHKNAVFKCNLCNFIYGNWFHAMEHIKDSKHMENWNKTYATTANYVHYENTELQFHELTSNRIFIGNSAAKAYHCHTCNLSFKNFKEAHTHISTIEHENLMSRFNDGIFEFKDKLPKDLEWIKNSNFMVIMKDKIYCKTCDVYLIEMKDIREHMKTHPKEPEKDISPDKEEIKKKEAEARKEKAAATAAAIVAASKSISEEQRKAFPECELRIPDYLIWVVKFHDVVVHKKYLYCSICKKQLYNNSAVEYHLQKHVETEWQKNNLPARYPKSAAAAKFKELAENPPKPIQSSSTSGVVLISGSAKRNATSSSEGEQVKIQKVDNLNNFKNVGNYIQILPQKNQAANNPLNKPPLLPTPGTTRVSRFSDAPPANTTTKNPQTNPKEAIPGSSVVYPTVLITPNNPNVKSRFQQGKPNLADLMKNIPSLMSKHPLQPKPIQTALLPTPSNTSSQSLINPMNNPKINQPIVNLMGNHPVQNNITNPPFNQMVYNNLSNQPAFNPMIQQLVANNMGNQLAFHQPVNNQLINNHPAIINPANKPPINAFPMNNYPLRGPLLNPINNMPINNPTINQPINNYPMNQQLISNPFATQESTSNIPLNNSTVNVTNNPSDPNSTSDQVVKKKVRSRGGVSRNPLLNMQMMIRLHKANYLFFTKNEIYEMNPEKRRRMILSSQLSFFVKYTNDYFIYCVVCEKSVPYNLQNVFEHWCCSQHNEYLTKIEEDDKQFRACPTQFSCLALSKEFMIENQSTEASSESYLKEFMCCACDVTVLDQDHLLREHFESEEHQTNIARFKRHSEKIYKEILPLVEGSWYSIEKYSCWPCKKVVANEVPYAEHLESKKHLSTVQALSLAEKKNYFFDSCAVCGLLWFGDENEYPKHCYQDAIHKDLTKHIEDRIDYLPEEANNLFSCPEAVISKLMEEVNQVRYDLGRESELIRSLELAVRRKFPEAKAYPFGSRVTGLGLIDSDIDIFLDCGGVYDGDSCHSIELIDRVHHCLKLDSQAWNVEKVIENSRTPIIKVYHSHSQLKCDVSFSNGLSVENTKLLKSYLDAYPQCKEMILFIKKWLLLCNISGSRNITNYAMSWFVIFFLQIKNILPSVASLLKDNPNLRTIAGWEVGVKQVIVSKKSKTLTTRELLKGFFCFYADFDYRFNLACPLLGKIMSKKEFLHLQSLIEEMKPYVEHVNSEIDPEFFRIDSPMCIQDPYDLSHNLTKGVKKIVVNRFRKLCCKAVQLLSSSD